MAELTLKDESVLEIGKSVSQSFEGLAKTGKSLVVSPSGSSAGRVDDFIGPRLPETNEGDSCIISDKFIRRNKSRHTRLNIIIYKYVKF